METQFPVFPESISDLTPIKLADGVVRHLRYTFGAKKRIHDAFGSEALDIIKTSPEKLLPRVLMEGLVEREGLTEELLNEELLTAPMADYVTECFIQAFFVPRIASNLRALMAIAVTSTPELIDKMKKAMKEPQVEEPPATVQ